MPMSWRAFARLSVDARVFVMFDSPGPAFDLSRVGLRWVIGPRRASSSPAAARSRPAWNRDIGFRNKRSTGPCSVLRRGDALQDPAVLLQEAAAVVVEAAGELVIEHSQQGLTREEGVHLRSGDVVDQGEDLKWPGE